MQRRVRPIKELVASVLWRTTVCTVVQLNLVKAAQAWQQTGVSIKGSQEC